MRRAELAIIAIAFVWGATFVVVKNALADASPVLFLALRFSLAALALGLIFRRAKPGGAVRARAVLAGSTLTGLFLFTGYALQTIGLRYTTASKSAFLTGLSIVLVPVFAAVFERKPPRPSEAVGVAIAAVGMGLMTLRGPSLAMSAGDLLTVGCAAAFAVHILLMGHYSPKFGFEVFTTLQIAVAAALAAGTFWWIEPYWVRWTPGLIAAIAVTGLLATALAFSVQSWAQQYTSPTRTALIFAAEPVFAWVTSFATAGEVLSRQAALGAGLILAGILLVELRRNGRGPSGR
ncbi:MAG: DMT family transporter [Acidobacteriota bacterium]